MMVHTRPAKIGQWSESALKVLRERYLQPVGSGASGSPTAWEAPEDMCWRVAQAIARAERAWGAAEADVRQIASQFYDLMVDCLFLPNSPTIMNAGAENGLQYSACYVLPVEDSIEGIFEAIKRAALIHQSGGGTGMSFSRLRPRNSPVRSSGGSASGPVSFMRVFDAATQAIKQGGKRRGANMGVLRVDHPDILEFVECKLGGAITNFNISVAITDTFMQALEQDEEYDLVAQPGWPRQDGGRYSGGETVGRLRAGDVWERIVQAAWRSGDPGLMFLDTVNFSPANPTPKLVQIESTNPCGEQSLPPNDACNLGSINLARFATSKGLLCWEELERVVRLAVRFLDDVIEVNPYPLPEIDATVKANRRIGLGIMGWADLLFELGIPYDSEAALELADEVMSFIQRIGHDESARLAEVRGAFPNWPRSIYKDDRPRRNATITTIAPTGSVSIIADCSSGIEPAFALAFEHRVKQPDGSERRLSFVNPVFARMAEAQGWYSENLMAEVARQGSLQGLEGVPAEAQRVFVIAHEIAPEWHVRMQAAFQCHVDNGVSKTINLPNSATVDDVAAAYRLAYDLGCRGITVFRDGCKGEQVLNLGIRESGKQEIRDFEDRGTGDEGRGMGDEAPRTSSLIPHPSLPGSSGEAGVEQLQLFPLVKPRPQALQGTTYRIGTPLGTAFITVNENEDGEPFEVFANVGKAGSDTAAVAEAVGRLISLCLRLPSSLSPRERLEAVVGQLSGIGGGRPLGFGPRRVRSLPDGLAQVLAEHLAKWQIAGSRWQEAGGRGQEAGGRWQEAGGRGQEAGYRLAESQRLAPSADLCPECGQATLVTEEGCLKCHTCGYGEC
ncbi:MAG: vitamin B12-dependent ribonucleotide reductase [Chloroflexi bacterium]|nr:vitamin B12-dependent ribonucleotide reductase [Chloroflexota bacterium]